jgi:dolichol-phosphate mannosyltransferase
VKLSVIIPAHNEEENIAKVIAKVKDSIAVPFELIIVNDHSQDSTAALVSGLAGSNPNIRLVENKRDKGFANALKTGCECASGDLVMPVMGDLSDDLSVVAKMLERISQGYDIVCGCRYMKGGGRIGGSKIKGLFSSFAGRSLHVLIGIPTRDIANAFKMYKKKVIESIRIEANGFEISMEIPLKAYLAGFKITDVPTVWREREKGKSSFKMFELCPRYFRLYLWGFGQILLRKICRNSPS